MKLRRNQQGLAHVWLILIILLVLAIIGFVGWRVWEAREDKKSNNAPKTSETEPPAEVVAYARPLSANYQVALPEGWVTGTCPDMSDQLFLAPSEDKLGKCNTESAGTVVVTRNNGNIGHSQDYYMGDPYYGEVAYTPVTIDGITGYKIAYSIATEDGLGYPPIGTQMLQYVLFDGTNTYTVTYTRLAGEPDYSSNATAIAESFDKL